MRRYPSCTATCTYQVQMNRERQDIVVIHWAVVNGRLLRSYSELHAGGEYDLVLLPLAQAQYVDEFPRYSDLDDLQEQNLRLDVFVSEKVVPTQWIMPEAMKEILHGHDTSEE
jgi:hypothetical protein